MSGTIYGTPKITTTLTSFDIATANKPEYALRVSDSGTEINGLANISGALTAGSANITGFTTVNTSVGASLILQGTEHVFMQWNPKTGGGRKAFMGFSNSTSTDLTIQNEFSSNVRIFPNIVTGSVNLSGALSGTTATLSGNLIANNLVIVNSVNSTQNTVRLKPLFNTKDSWFQFQNSTTTDNTNNIFDFVIEDTFNRISTRNNRDLVLRSGNSGAGNVLIQGSAILSDSLTVNSNANISGQLTAQSAYIGNLNNNGNVAQFSHANFKNNTNNYALVQDNAGGTYINSATNQPIRFSNNDQDRMILASNGNFGIGTTNPTAKLDVNGSANISGALTTSSVATNAISTNSVTIGGINAPIMGGNWVTANMPGGFSGAIGANHPRPEGGFIMANQSSGGDLPWGYYMGTHKDVANATPNSLRLDFGEIRTLPTAQFPSANPSFLSYMTIRTGRVGINQNNPGQALHVMGNGFFSGSVIQGSDARLKENIGPLDEVETHIKVLQLQPKSYQLIDRGNDDRIDIGLIAQEVKPIFPELVFEDDEGMMALCYDKVSILMLQSIKQLQKQIDELKNEIIQLKKIKMCNNIA